MVKPDVTRNYYADLELPNDASLDDIKKQYRKLALQHHPDRNPGKESDCIPRFQAIQAAHEVLGDAATKAKYDTDRRKAGLYPTPPGTANASTWRPAPRGNPYQATSPFPPPPRRTQPNPTWAPNSFGRTPNTPNGAERFTNFGRAAPTAKKDPAQERADVFSAWQNLNNAQRRQQATGAAGRGGFGNNAPPPPPQPGASPRRPAPPRQHTNFPSEDEIRAGIKHRKPPPPPPQQPQQPPSQAQAEATRAMWQNFQAAQQPKRGMGRSNTTRTPKKAGFDPTAAGSDERPAPHRDYSYHARSHDFTANGGLNVPPPPSGPPPAPQTSPVDPRYRPQFGDPLKPFKNREDAPFIEGTRTRTPYTSYSGEKTDFSSDAFLRRSNSTRDTTKLHTESAPNGDATNRPRSSSPVRKSKSSTGHDHTSQAQASGGKQKPFVVYSSSDEDDDAKDAETSPPRQRPKKVPTPVSARMNGGSGFATPIYDIKTPNGTHHTFGTTTPADNASESEAMQQKKSGNMYADSFHHDSMHRSAFSPGQWAYNLFGSGSTPDSKSKTASSWIPFWAIPSSISPSTLWKKKEAPPEPKEAVSAPPEKVVAEDPAFDAAFYDFVDQIEAAGVTLPTQWTAVNKSDTLRDRYSTWFKSLILYPASEPALEHIMLHVFSLHPSLYALVDCIGKTHGASADRPSNRFDFPIDNATFSPANTAFKSRSEENINTAFSPEGWKGAFTGSVDYFAPPPPTGRKASTTRGRKPVPVPNTNGGTAPNGFGPMPEMPPPPQPSQHGHTAPQQPGSAGFMHEDWAEGFKDNSWAFPPPTASSPPRTAASNKTPSRKGSKNTVRSATDPTHEKAANNAGARPQPARVLDESEETVVEEPDEHAEEFRYDDDAMDIDSSTPPQPQAQQTQPHESTPSQADKAKEPRLYAVPPSPWRQHQQQPNGHGTTANGTGPETPLTTALADLHNVEPIGPAPSASGLTSLAALGATLPFLSQASAAPALGSLAPRALQLPPIPKAPDPPVRLSHVSWRAFAANFGVYLREFHAFNTTMLDHFNARHAQDGARFAGGDAFLEAVGDGGSLLGVGFGRGYGFGGFVQGVLEDERVREAWNVGQERHVEACTGFEKVRDRVRRLVEGGGLKEL